MWFRFGTSYAFHTSFDLLQGWGVLCCISIVLRAHGPSTWPSDRRLALGVPCACAPIKFRSSSGEVPNKNEAEQNNTKLRTTKLGRPTLDYFRRLLTRAFGKKKSRKDPARIPHGSRKEFVEGWGFLCLFCIV